MADAYQQQMDQYANETLNLAENTGKTVLHLLYRLAEEGYEALKKESEERKQKEAEKEQTDPTKNKTTRAFSPQQVAQNQAAFLSSFNNIFNQTAVPTQTVENPAMSAPGANVPGQETDDHKKILDQIVQTIKDTGATITADNLIQLANNYTYEEYMGLVADGLAGFEFNQEQEYENRDVDVAKLCNNQEVAEQTQGLENNAIDVSAIDDLKLSDCIGTPLQFAVPELGMVAVDIGIRDDGTLHIDAHTLDGMHAVSLDVGPNETTMDLNTLGGLVKGEINMQEMGHIQGNVQALDGAIDVANIDLDFNTDGQIVGENESPTIVGDEAPVRE